MKKALLIVAMLLSVVPVMATTTITAVNEGVVQTPDGNYMATVSIGYVTDVNVRAFALDINIEEGPAFQRIRDFKTGESNAVSPGYGIFPSRFRDFIVVTGPNWVDVNYNPTTAWNEPETTDHNSGMGWPKMIVEMGTLYAGDANKPLWSGTLFRFDVNGYGSVGTYHLKVAANALRGGVVGNDGNTITPTLVGCDIVFPAPTCVLPNVVSQPEATATDSITAAGFVLGARTETCSDVPGIVAGDIISTNPVAGSYDCGTSVDYVVSTGACCVIVPNVVGQAEATATANITAAGLTLGVRTTACSVTYAAGLVISTNPANPTCVPLGTAVDYVVSVGTTPNAPASITVPAADADGVYNITWTAPVGGTPPTSYQLESSAPASGTTVYPLWVQVYSGTALTYPEKVGGGTWSYRVTATNACGTSGYTTGGTNCVVSMSLKATATGYADWVKYRYPACWAFRRHCKGDINGKKAIVGGYVSPDDLNIFRAVYGLSVAQIAAAPCTTFTVTQRICGFCADLDHKNKLVGGRVSADDLGIFRTYYGAADATVTCCDTAAPAADCTLVAGDPFNFWTN